MNNEKISGKRKHRNIQTGAEISRVPKNGMDGRYIEKVINGDNNPKIPTIINRVPETTNVPVLSFLGRGGGGPPPAPFIIPPSEQLNTAVLTQVIKGQEFELNVTDENKKPIPDAAVTLILPNGTEKVNKTDENGILKIIVNQSGNITLKKAYITVK